MSFNPTGDYSPGFGEGEQEFGSDWLSKSVMPPPLQLLNETLEIMEEDEFQEGVKEQKAMLETQQKSGSSANILMEFFESLNSFGIMIAFKPILAEITKLLAMVMVPLIKRLVPLTKDLATQMARVEPFLIIWEEHLASLDELTLNNIGIQWEEYWNADSTWLFISQGWEAFSNLWEDFWNGDLTWESISNEWEDFWEDNNTWKAVKEAWDKFWKSIGSGGSGTPTGISDGDEDGECDPCNPFGGCYDLFKCHPIFPFAKGGITQGPRKAIVGDNPSGIEAVIPLEKASEFGFGGGSMMLESKLDVLIAQNKMLLKATSINSRRLRRNG